MWEKFRRGAYLVMAKYILIAAILAVLVFQFLTFSLYFREPFFKILFTKETLVIMIAAIVGIFAGAFVYLMFFLQGNNQVTKDKVILHNANNQSRLLFYLRYFIIFGFGGFAAVLFQNIFALNDYENLIQILFSRTKIIDYTGIFVSAGIFGFIFSIGLKRRLKKLYSST